METLLSPADFCHHLSDFLASNTENFITRFEVRRESTCLFLKCHYDIARFQKALFSRLNIERPPILAQAVEKRLAEFLAGRVLAKYGQACFGLIPEPIDIGCDRAPIWPSMINGSISHSCGYCVCLIVPRSVGVPGVDIEVRSADRSVGPILELITNSRESELVSSLPDSLLAATLCFSAKETLFKSLHPEIRRYIDFKSAEIYTAPKNETIHLRLTENLNSKLSVNDSFQVNYTLSKEFVLTWMVRRNTQAKKNERSSFENKAVATQFIDFFAQSTPAEIIRLAS